MLSFFVIIFVANLLVILQGIASHQDGYFSQKQMEAQGVSNGWAFIEHGGMWGDFFIISPVMALIVSRYHLGYLSSWGIVILLISVTFSLCAKYAFSKRGNYEPEAHSHDGRTTLTGWLHGVYEVPGYWIIPMFLLTLIKPQASMAHLLIVASALTVHVPLGVIKFNPRWKLSRLALGQTVLAISAVWLIVGYRLYCR